MRGVGSEVIDATVSNAKNTAEAMSKQIASTLYTPEKV